MPGRLSETGIEQAKNPAALSPQTGETLKELFNRTSSFLHEVLSQHHKDTVLFVGHSRINRAIIAVITGKGPGDIDLIEKPHNTSITIFEIDEDRNHKIHVFNCIEHLA